MRRFALIFGILLTLTAGVWSSALAAASAWCMHEASAPAAPDEHDCCRAKIGDSHSQHSDSEETAHDAAHETATAQVQVDEARAGMHCDGAGVSATSENAPVAFGQRGLSSCAGCCAGGSGQTPPAAAFVAPEQHKVKRDAGSNSNVASELFAPAPSRVSHLAPTQHAPPAPPDHRHILNSVFLI